MTAFIKMGVAAAALAAALLAAAEPQKASPDRKQHRFVIVTSIGLSEADKEEDKSYVFSSIVSADIDSEGNIYTLDYREACVKVFSPSGRFRTQFLRPGQGPGEVQNPFRLRVSPEGKHIFVLHQNGFQIKEFNDSGDFVRIHPLPKQIFDYFDFLDAGHLLFIDGLPFGQKSFANLKVYAIREKKFEKEFAVTNIDYFTGFQRFVVRDGIVWTCPGDLMELEAYDLETGDRKKTLPLPEEYEPYQNLRWGQNIQKTRVWNYAQPFECAGNIYVLVTRQQFTPKPRDLLDSPLSRKITLYRLDGGRVVKETGFPAFDFYPEFLSARNSRILISSSPYDLYPQLAVLELR
ncbi:MAG: 6-bladed beta-propeller [Candidatus Aminicenantales bacterium]